MFEVQRRLRKTQNSLKKLDEEEERDIAPAGLFNYFFGTGKSTEEEAQRQRRAAERSTGRIVHQAKLQKFQSDIANLESRVKKLDGIINMLKDDMLRAEQRQKDRVRDAREELERRQKAARAQRAREEKEKREKSERERAARERAERERAEKERAERERAKIWREMERDREEKKRAEKQKAAKERAKTWRERERVERESAARECEEWLRASGSRSNGFYGVGFTGVSSWSPSDESPCLHGKWWTQVQGQYFCERCDERVNRFAFQCPGCSMVACANCRNALKWGAR